MVWGAAPSDFLVANTAAMSLPRTEARERGSNTESCHQRIVSTSRLPHFFLLLISRVWRSRALVSCGLGPGAGDKHTSLPFGLDDRGPGAGFDFGCESLALDRVAALADTNLPLPIATFANRRHWIPRNCYTSQTELKWSKFGAKNQTGLEVVSKETFVTC